MLLAAAAAVVVADGDEDDNWNASEDSYLSMCSSIRHVLVTLVVVALGPLLLWRSSSIRWGSANTTTSTTTGDSEKRNGFWRWLCRWRRTVVAAAEPVAGGMPLEFSNVNTNRTASSNLTATTKVPFVVWGDDPDWKLLQKALAAHERERHGVLETLSRQLQLALSTEHDMLLSSNRRRWRGKSKYHHSPHAKLLSMHLQQRIEALSEIYRSDLLVLQGTILKPFDFVKALPASSHGDDSEDKKKFTSRTASEGTGDGASSGDDGKSFLFQYTVRRGPVDDTSAGYDSVAQVVAHLVRDWSPHGGSIRQSVYSWFLSEMQEHKQVRSIMVPGAGLGRLAYELATATRARNSCYRVHAIELSLTFAAAAHMCFTTNESVSLHPYANDYFTNEVDSKERYQEVDIPDVFPSASSILRRGQLSYTIGDFVEVASAYREEYEAVVTCFFIDTATNVYEYIQAIYQVLKPGGVWLNVGPLQWHYNSLIQMSANELRDLLLAFGFHVVKWDIDTKPIEYRNEFINADKRQRRQQAPRSTHYDAYCPLRYVVQKPKHK